MHTWHRISEAAAGSLDRLNFLQLGDWEAHIAACRGCWGSEKIRHYIRMMTEVYLVQGSLRGETLLFIIFYLFGIYLFIWLYARNTNRK